MSSSFFIICVLLVKIFLRGFAIIWIANSFRSVAKTRSSVRKERHFGVLSFSYASNFFQVYVVLKLGLLFETLSNKRLIFV